MIEINFGTTFFGWAQLLAYEMSNALHYNKEEIQTPLAKTTASVVDSPIVITSILRAGLHLHQGLLSMFDDANSGFIAAYRRHKDDGSFDIYSEYTTCPNLDGKYLVVADPMLASGSSATVALQSLERYGSPKAIHFVCVIAAQAGIEYLLENYPNIDVWAAVVDPELNQHAYIVPGLGDAGDLMYGPKLQG